MTDSLRTRIAAVLRRSWPAPWFDGGRQHQQVADLADAVISELGLCQQCEHIHRAATHCGHQTIETIRVGNGRYDFGRGGSVWREIVTDECRCDLRQHTIARIRSAEKLGLTGDGE